MLRESLRDVLPSIFTALCWKTLRWRRPARGSLALTHRNGGSPESRLQRIESLFQEGLGRPSVFIKGQGWGHGRKRKWKAFGSFIYKNKNKQTCAILSKGLSKSTQRSESGGPGGDLALRAPRRHLQSFTPIRMRGTTGQKKQLDQQQGGWREI